MKKLSVIAALLMLASCGHKAVDPDRNPAYDRNPSATTQVMSCGLLGSSESVRNAVDVNPSMQIDDRMYTLQVDCNKDRVVDLEKEQLIVGVPMSQVSSAQKGWITRWRKIAVKNQKNQAAKPYVCMNYGASFDPCAANRNVYGVAPKFSSKVVVSKKVK